MNNENVIKEFEKTNIRTIWDDEKEKYYFSVVDVIKVLTDSTIPRRYWADLKSKLIDEGSELYEKIVQLKMKSSDGKFYSTDTLDTKGILRLVQSVPSPKAEPFKIWLAQVGNDRIDEVIDPELAINRALLTYKKKGHSDEWINQRVKTIEARKELTNEWDRTGVEESNEYAILTNEMYKAWSDLSAKEYKQYKGLKKENLRDHMSNVELVLNMFAEVSTTELIKNNNPFGLEENKVIAKQGGNIAKKARIELENQLGRSVISKNNNKPKKI